MSHSHPSFQDQLRMVAYCPVCHARYRPRDADIVEERGDAHLLHLQCKKCANYVLALIVAQPQGISAMGMVTDFNRDDVRRFAKLPPLTTDDCMEFGQALTDTASMHAWTAAKGNE
ncbi:hypothetical protein HY629_00485 [Candidatus Uhrbacteria bacterium]|nr:hypothetical protein [Candidatus Uhrbacteria bacterium]